MNINEIEQNSISGRQMTTDELFSLGDEVLLKPESNIEGQKVVHQITLEYRENGQWKVNMVNKVSSF